MDRRIEKVLGVSIRSMTDDGEEWIIECDADPNSAASGSVKIYQEYLKKFVMNISIPTTGFRIIASDKNEDKDIEASDCDISELIRSIGSYTY